MRLPANKTEVIRLLKRTVTGGFALLLQTIILGNVVRLRAQYVPKVVQLDPEDGKDVMGVSYMRMLKRVIKLEGWKGLLRGIVPLAIATVVPCLWCLVANGCALVPFDPILNAILRYFLSVVLDIPFTIFFVRSITLPVILPFFGIHHAVHTLLSPEERRRPWLLYHIPGLLLVVALEQAWVTLLIPVLVKLVTRRVPELWLTNRITVRSLTLLSLVFVQTAIFGPLEMIKVRLAIRRYEQPIALPEDQHDSLGPGDVTNGAEPPEAAEARVLRLRTDSDQPAYTSLFNCVRSIIAEEGLETIYRAWWFTLLVALVKVNII